MFNEYWGFPGGSDPKESACNAEDPGSIPGLGRSLREGNGNPLQYSCLENPMDRGAWRTTVLGVGCKELGMTLCVSLNITIFACLLILREILERNRNPWAFGLLPYL